MKRTGPNLRIALVALSALVAMAALPIGVHVMMRPVTLKLAVGPAQSEDSRLVTAIAQVLVREEAGARLKIVPVDGYDGAAKALNSGAVQAAVLRSDVPTPADARTVAILHRNAAVFVAPQGRGITEIVDLAGKRIGVLRLGPVNERLLDTVLAYYDIPPTGVSRIGLQPHEVGPAVKDGTIDALLVIGPASGPLVTGAVQDVARMTGAAPVFLPLREATAIAQRNPAFDAIEIARGGYGAAPAVPPLSYMTLGVGYRLALHASVHDAVATELTRTIFENRRDLVDMAPIAAFIEAPDTEKVSLYEVHPGAALYLDGEEPSFFEKYADWLYLGAMGAGLVASGGAALWGRRRSRSGDAGLRAERLIDLLRRAREADDARMLDGIEREADALLLELMRSAAEDGPNAGTLAAAGLGLDHVRAAVRDRRSVLAR